MKLSDIKKEYFLLLEDKMKEFGFKPNKKDFAFKKETKRRSLSNIYHLQFWS